MVLNYKKKNLGVPEVKEISQYIHHDCDLVMAIIIISVEQDFV